MINVLIHVSDQDTLNQMLKNLGITRYTVDITRENQIEFDLSLPRKQKEPKQKCVVVDTQAVAIAEAAKRDVERMSREKECPICHKMFVPNGKQKYCDDCKKEYGQHCTRELRRRNAAFAD